LRRLISLWNVRTLLSAARAHERLTYDAQKVWRTAVHRSLQLESTTGGVPQKKRPAPLARLSIRDSKAAHNTNWAQKNKHRPVEKAFCPKWRSRSGKTVCSRYFAGRFAGGLFYCFCTTIAEHKNQLVRNNLVQIGSFVAPRRGPCPGTIFSVVVGPKGETFIGGREIISVKFGPPVCWRVDDRVRSR